ncbi:MAG: phenylalanine--tRNA ligase subunit alpha [Alphaproteobacteria bacterium]
MQDLSGLKASLLAAIEAVADEKSLEEIRIRALGKKGEITASMKNLGSLAPEERKNFGQELNLIKQEVAEAINKKDAFFKDEELNRRLSSEMVDITLSPRPESVGKIHPLNQVMEEVVAIFASMGFSVAEGPNIETQWYNFDALNIPLSHPARQEMDTFYMPNVDENGERLVLRTHTSTAQIRTMESQKPPIRIICLGRTYRNESDATHSPMFHQLEGLLIDEKTHMGHLKGCLKDFLEAFFNVKNLPMRYRASYFPFTEPSMEVDIACRFEDGQLIIGEGDRWLEILGSGMVNPKVLENCGIDSNKYQGFAFGIGLERITMLKYGMNDLRRFYESDLRWLRHYGFNILRNPTLHGGIEG